MSPRARKLVTLLAALAPLAAAGACSDENRPGTYNGPSYSGNTGVLNEGGPSSSSGEGGGVETSVVVLDGGGCESRTQLCRPFTTPGGTAPGVINGGSLVQGTYILEGSTGAAVPCHTLYLADGFFHDIEATPPAVDGGPSGNTYRSSAFVVNGTGLALTEVCPTAGAKTSASFGFDGTLLTIQLPGRTDVYRKQ